MQLHRHRLPPNFPPLSQVAHHISVLFDTYFLYTPLPLKSKTRPLLSTTDQICPIPFIRTVTAPTGSLNPNQSIVTGSSLQLHHTVPFTLTGLKTRPCSWSINKSTLVSNNPTTIYLLFPVIYIFTYGVPSSQLIPAPTLFSQIIYFIWQSIN